MGKIVAIGGGENGRANTNYETENADREIVALTNKVKPTFLFIGVANNYPDRYFDAMAAIYGGRFGCETDYMRYEELRDLKTAKRKIENADIIYVGGGNTYKLMTLFRIFGTDVLLRSAYADGKVLCGMSAGAICWCKYGNSDSRMISSHAPSAIRVGGLGFVDVLFCPHYKKEGFRADSLKAMMKRTYRVPAVGLDYAALEIVDGKYRIIALDSRATAKKFFWQCGVYIERELMTDSFLPIEELLAR